MATIELKVMVGIPGSGKSTWADNEMRFLELDGFTTAIISRDCVRQSLIGDNPSAGAYFNRERKVFEEFVRQINEAMEIGINYVFVDATHISPASRAKILGRLRPDPSTNLVFEVIDCSLETCLARNSERTGFAKVPDSAILKMKRGFKEPTMAEFVNYKYGFKDVIIHHHSTERRGE